MNVSEFISKWKKVELTERSASQQHFIDLCNLLGHQPPASLDPTGESFTFEKGAAKHGGGKGWADVWKKGFFAWEYKGKHKDLDAAYDQLLQYREDLENPPLLVVCDLERLIIHTNFTATPTQIYDIPLEEIGKPRNLEVLRALFHEPWKLKPGTTSIAITTEAASRLAKIAQSLRDRGIDPKEIAHFLDRVVFCLFAEDIELLPKDIFTRMLEKTRNDPTRFTKLMKQLFEAMINGGDFGMETIRHFNGHLFDKASVVELIEDEINDVYTAAKLDWSAVDPSIFGTLFERGMDPAKRSQLGAHYTSREDIETLVEPVVVQPLRRKWDETCQLIRNLLTAGKKKPTGKEKKPPSERTLKKGRKEAGVIMHRFLRELSEVKVLDPACGSGNFLYVTLQKLKDLEKEAILYSMDNGLGSFLPLVGPWQLHGIEISPYAFDLAQMTVWIGYLQWTKANGFGITQEPILRPMEGNFKCMDAILNLSDPENPKEPEWKKVDFIVGNPPFLGGKFLRRELGDEYVDKLFQLWNGRVPHEADLCCYWFEKAREQVEKRKCKRAGLLATQGIRGGANREVLKRIKESGDIFFAESDRPWILDGANVHVSMIGFDEGEETSLILDGKSVPSINPNLSSIADITQVKRLSENIKITFMGDTKGGPFDIEDSIASDFLFEPNPHGLPNSSVVVPWVNGMDITGRSRSMWIIDFGVGISKNKASQFQTPFEFVVQHVKPKRKNNARETYRRLWWLHVEPRPGMRSVIAPLSRFLTTVRVSKHRLFVWMMAPALPDSAIFVFARDDDYFFGVLHSCLHEAWALCLGTRLETRPRYTPTTCFETFPFPWPPGEEPKDEPKVQAIANAARELDELRNNWLNPPEWTKEEMLEFPGSIDGPWSRYVHNPDGRGIGTVRYPRIVPKDEECAKKLKKRTLTNLYNERPTWMDLAHQKLDEAVFAAYGWNPDMSDEKILEKLLELNLERASYQ